MEALSLKVCIVDTKSANFNSVVQAIKRLGVTANVTNDLKELAQADKLIMPGVGSASAVMSGLLKQPLEQIPALCGDEKHISSELTDFICQYQKPLLGICLGMQVQAQCSQEVPLQAPIEHINTLGLIKGTVHLLNVTHEPLPHMGWNTIEHNDHPLFKGIAQGSYFYFVHSFCLDVTDNTIAKSNYGQDFSAAIAKDNFMGVQFHPEKSGANGERLLQNFLDL